jgi:hypothetical protein
MRVIPSDDHLGPSSLFEHVQHLGLENVIHGFDGDRGTGLRHCEYVYAGDLRVDEERRNKEKSGWEEVRYAGRDQGEGGLTVVASMNSPNIRPITSIGTPTANRISSGKHQYPSPFRGERV